MDKNEKLVEWLTQAAQRGGEFVEREAPQYAAELLAWHFWSAIAAVAGGAALLLVGLALIWYARRLSELPEATFSGPPNSTNVSMLISSIAAGVAILVGCMVMAHNGYNAAKVAIAPRVVIVQSLR